MAYCLMYFFIAIVLLTLCRKLLSTKPPPNLFPYSRPNLFFYLKAVLFYLMIAFRKRRNSSSAGYGSSSYKNISQMEQQQKLVNKEIKAIDAVFFSGANSKGWSIILAMQRRPNGVSTILAYIKIPGNGIFVPKSHPDCQSFRNEDDENMFKSGGLEITMVIPMEKWRLEYIGTLNNAENPVLEIDVSMKLEFNSKWRYFDFDTDMDQWATSKSFAREPWSSQFFQNLQAHHQTHYEQMGDISGTVSINGNISNITMSAFRDHSYGSRREWSLMHRYTFHHIFLEDGSKGVVGVVCQPTTCTRLVCGHWWLPTGEGYPISEANLELQNHGEGGDPPKDYAFQFTAGGKMRTIKVTTEDSAVHYLGWDWEAKFYELFVAYEVDGIAGYGICEWEYSNKTGRPSRYTDNDPNWTKSLRLQYLAN